MKETRHSSEWKLDPMIFQGMSFSEVLRIADWSSDNVFKTFYFKPLILGHNLFLLQLLIMIIINTLWQLILT